jgi:hypothetical protein
MKGSIYVVNDSRRRCNGGGHPFGYCCSIVGRILVIKMSLVVSLTCLLAGWSNKLLLNERRPQWNLKYLTGSRAASSSNSAYQIKNGLQFCIQLKEFLLHYTSSNGTISSIPRSSMVEAFSIDKSEVELTVEFTFNMSSETFASRL